MIFAPLFAGYMYDRYESYFIPFLAFSVLAFLGALLMLTVRRPRLTQPTASRQQEATAD